jgi:toxin ParE1/3/4
MSVRLLAEAEAEAQAPAQQYESQRSGLGDEFLDAVADALTRIETQPYLFPRMETLTTTREIRRVVLDRFSYIIIYEIRADETLVFAVAHSRRRPNYWQNRQP